MVIGDLVNYRNYVAVVNGVKPLSLALNTGQTITCQESEVVLLMSRSQILEVFEDNIRKGCGHEAR